MIYKRYFPKQPPTVILPHLELGLLVSLIGEYSARNPEISITLKGGQIKIMDTHGYLNRTLGTYLVEPTVADWRRVLLG